jgi:hypothetical protein
MGGRVRSGGRSRLGRVGCAQASTDGVCWQEEALLRAPVYADIGAVATECAGGFGQERSPVRTLLGRGGDGWVQTVKDCSRVQSSGCATSNE